MYSSTAFCLKVLYAIFADIADKVYTQFSTIEYVRTAAIVVVVDCRTRVSRGSTTAVVILLCSTAVVLNLECYELQLYYEDIRYFHNRVRSIFDFLVILGY